MTDRQFENLVAALAFVYFVALMVVGYFPEWFL